MWVIEDPAVKINEKKKKERKKETSPQTLLSSPRLTVISNPTSILASPRNGILSQQRGISWLAIMRLSA